MYLSRDRDDRTAVRATIETTRVFAAKSLVRREDVTSGNTTYYLAGTMVDFTYSVVFARAVAVLVGRIRGPARSGAFEGTAPEPGGMTDERSDASTVDFSGNRPQLADSAFVSRLSYLVGEVSVGERASVWPFVCARGDGGPVTIGAGSNVQEFTMLHGATLEERVAVGHGAVIDYATIEPGSLVGMHSTVMRGATVESNALVAAGAVVRGGQTVPEGHMAYGVPAETRPLTDEQREQIELVQEHYVELSREYKAEGRFE